MPLTGPARPPRRRGLKPLVSKEQWDAYRAVHPVDRTIEKGREHLSQFLKLKLTRTTYLRTRDRYTPA